MFRPDWPTGIVFWGIQFGSPFKKNLGFDSVLVLQKNSPNQANQFYIHKYIFFHIILYIFFKNPNNLTLSFYFNKIEHIFGFLKIN